MALFSNTLTALAPYTSAETITPDDTTDLTRITRAIIIDGSGSHHDVVVTLANDADGTSVTLHVAKGVVVPIRAKRIWATGTGAGAVVALY